MGRRIGVDARVVEANIHCPTDSSLPSDGVRVLTRTMKKGREALLKEVERKLLYLFPYAETFN
jgi:hypothetical protein